MQGAIMIYGKYQFLCRLGNEASHFTRYPHLGKIGIGKRINSKRGRFALKKVRHPAQG